MIIIVAAQVVVPHMEMPQVTALVLLSTFIGASVGNTVAGAIYTGSFKDYLHQHLGSSATSDIVNAVYESITSTEIPLSGTPERSAVNLAYSDVLRDITYGALATSALCVLLAIFMPNFRLSEQQNPLTESPDAKNPDQGHAGGHDAPSLRTTVVETDVTKS